MQILMVNFSTKDATKGNKKSFIAKKLGNTPQTISVMVWVNAMRELSKTQMKTFIPNVQKLFYFLTHSAEDALGKIK